MKIKLLFAFLFTCFHVIFIDRINTYSFATTFSLLIPFDIETGSLRLMSLFLHLVFCIIFLVYVQKELDIHFQLITYTRTRTTLKKQVFILSKDLYKKIVSLFMIQLAVSFLFSQMSADSNIREVIILMVSLLFSVFLWSEIFMIFKLKSIDSKFTYLMLLTVILVSYLVVDFTIIAHLFIIGTWALLEMPIQILLLKLFSWVGLFVFKVLFFKKFEYLGGVKND